MSDGLAPRRAALQAIADVDERGAWSTLAVPDRVAALADARDRALASHLAYDTIRWSGTLDWVLSHDSRRAPSEIEAPLLRILRMGALQLTRMRVPARAVVDTSASLARDVVPAGRAKGAAGFVNGILRGLSRRLDGGPGLPWPTGDDPASIGLRTAHPAWLVTDAQRRFGAEAEAVLEADNVPPGLSLRAQGDPEALVEELRGLGIDATRHAEVAAAVLAPGADPRRLAAVAEGRATPQDAASMLVSLAVGARPGDHCLDVCAGPGGKATHLATLVGPTGTVTAVELHEHRARLVDQTAQRLGLDNVTSVVGDARTLALDRPTYDRVLVDAPCTGLGVGRRRPEVRWRRQPQDAASLAQLQVELLVRAATHVAPGGRLVYAVCTWTHEETVGVLEHPRVVAATESFAAGAIRQVRPDLDDADGMFIATFECT